MKTWAVIRREYLERVRSKGFVIGTVLGPLLMASFVVVPALLTHAKIGEQRTVAIIDVSGQTLEPLRLRLAELDKGKGRDQGRYTLLPVSLDSRTLDQGVSELKRMVQNESVYGGLIIDKDFLANRKTTLYVKSVAAMGMKEDLRPALDEVLRTGRFQARGIDPTLRAFLAEGADWSTMNVGAEGKESRAAESAYVVAIVLILIMYMMVLMYGAHTLQAVVEEKSSRVVEVLLSSLSPASLMFGKVIGIGAAGLTQTGIWTAAFFLVSQQGVSVGNFKLDTSFLSPMILVSFLIFFLLGFFLYALIYAGIGAMCNTIQDSQQFNMPVMTGLILPMMLLSFVLDAPDSTLAVALSLFPPFAPVLMFMRVCVQTPPLWQIGLSWLLLLGAIWLAARGAGKLFRLGVLMYGASPTWATLIRALRSN